jgi:hypothetical protein
VANYRDSRNTNNSNKTTQDKTNNKNKTEKKGSDKAFYTQTRLTKIICNLQTVFAAGTHLAEGQWLKELRMFRVGTRMPTVSRTEGLVLLLEWFHYKRADRTSSRDSSVGIATGYRLA